MSDLIVATVADVNSSGVTLVIPPASVATQKRYKRLITGGNISSGDLVLVAKLSGTHVVLGKIDYS